MNPKTHECPTCGYEWRHGYNGDHNCSDFLQNKINGLRAALNKIAKWHGEFPETGEFYDEEKTQPISFGAAAYGSNGQRDFMRGIAIKALDEFE